MCLNEKIKIKASAIEKNRVCEADQESSKITINFTLILGF